MRISFSFLKHWRRISQNLAVALLIFALFCLAFRLWPHPPLSQGLPLSSTFYDKNGKLLRLTLANDEQFRLWTPLEEIPTSLIDGVQLHEDQWFYYHPGFNPVSLMRGIWQSYIVSGQRQGGSTLTMQLARMYWKLNTRTPRGKLLQIVRAIQLELSYSKRDILEAYLNFAPYGRNIESIGAASLIYFDKLPKALTLPEALTLAVLPQSPSYRIDRNTGTVSPSLSKARNQLYSRWVEKHPEDKNQSTLFQLPLTLRQPEKMPYIAPHFVEQLAQHYARNAQHPGTVITTLDVNLQTLLEKQVNAFVLRNQSRGIRNSAVLLLDTRDMGVRALIGSADYFNPDIQGQVNGTLAKRSPGSTLKPFIFALGFDQGVIHPMTILKDVPSSFGTYAPENFDRRFLGPLSATDALNYSRNIPAVYVASRLSRPNIYQFLRQAGISRLASEKHYGLALVLGGGEVSVQELARLYAMLPNKGIMKPLRFEQANTSHEQNFPLLSEEAAFMTMDVLRQHHRPGSSIAQVPDALPVYWKTGTSWGFRDAWSVGIFGPYVLVVWQGNFDGKGNNAFVGADAAAPLFFNIIDSLRAEYPLLRPLPLKPPKNIKQVEICLTSGDLVTSWCQRKGKTWFIPGKSPIKVDTVFRPVVIDKQSGKAACRPYDPEKTQIEVFEFWPSDLLQVFAQAGLPKKIPPSNKHCRLVGSAVNGTPPRITSPLLKTTYTIRRNEQQNNTIIFTATTDADTSTVYWFVDDAYLGRTTTGNSLAWIPTRTGNYRIRAVDDRGRGDGRTIRVELLQ